MKIDLEVNEPSLCVGDLKLGDVFQIRETRADFYMVVQLFTSHVRETKPSDSGCVVLSLMNNQVIKLRSESKVILIHDVVITNKGK